MQFNNRSTALPLLGNRRRCELVFLSAIGLFACGPSGQYTGWSTTGTNGGMSTGSSGSTTSSGSGSSGTSVSSGGSSSSGTPGGVGSSSSSGAGKGGSSGGQSDAGGSSGGGDASGAPGFDAGPPPVHMVGACNGLAAVNTFENITPPQATLSNNGIVQILLDSVHSGTIYAGTDSKGLYKSTDCGSTWTKVNTGRNGSVLDSGILWSMAIDPVYPNIIFAGSLYGSNVSLFRSTNGGVDWDSMFPDGSQVAQTVQYNFFQDLSIDPTNHAHVVVTFHADCTGQFAPNCLAETLDSGQTWRLFKGPLGGWAEGAGPLILGGTTWLMGTVQSGLFYTNDSGGTWQMVAPGADHEIYHAKDGTYYTGSDYGINRSSDGHVWTQVANSPRGYGITGDGKRLFNSLRDASGNNGQPYYTSAETDGNTWTALSSPTMNNGAVTLLYDSDHHLLYSANTSSGLWRMVTQ